MAVTDRFRQREELTPIHLNNVQGDSVTDFDLYINIGGHLVLYAPRPYRWHQDEIDRLYQDGHAQLYYDFQDESKVSVYQLIHTLPVTESLLNLEPQKRINRLMELIASFNKIFQNQNLTTAGLEKGQEIAEKLTDCIQEDPNCIKIIETLQEHHKYTYFHSARVAAYSIALAIEMSNPTDSELQDLGIGCMLHDIGKVNINSDILNREGQLDEREWAMIKKHPENGLAMVGNAKIGLVSKEIILHHHEREDGGGYPHGLSGVELLPEVKIAAFSDIFDALTSKRPYQKTRTRYEALDFIRFHLLDMVDRDSFKAMVNLLK